MKDKKTIGIRCNITDEAHQILNKYVEAKRKRFGLKKDGKKYNMPDAIQEIILNSNPVVNEVIRQWESELKEIEKEKSEIVRRFSTGA